MKKRDRTAWYQKNKEQLKKKYREYYWNKYRETYKKNYIPKPPHDQSGEKSHFWEGGKSFEPYTTDWTDTLKRSIRERDHYICGICGLSQGEEALCVHHIDYDKKNCSPDNLISLHRSCHNKTTFNRDYWIEYFMVNRKK